MAYKGETFRIALSQSGFNGNPNTDLLPPYSLIDAINMNLHNGMPENRGGTSHVNSSAISGSPQLMGGWQGVFKNGNIRTIVATSDGKLYHSTNSYAGYVKSGLTINKATTFLYWNDNVYICNGADPPQVYNGTTVSALANAKMPSDWTTAPASYPTKMVVHGKGVSERLWGIGVSQYPFSVYASDNGTDDFKDATVIKLNIRTEQGSGLINLIEFGDRLFILSKDRPYIINDDSSTVANWGYAESQFKGGCAGVQLLIRLPNDIVAMSDDGDIFSITAVQSYGDYKGVSITRPHYIHKWIQDNVDLSQISKFHMIYDPYLRAIRIFVVMNGETKVSNCLVYFIDRQLWVNKHNNALSASGFDASCSFLVEDTSENYRVYTGDYSGFIWELEKSTFNDNGNAYIKSIKLPYTDFENPRFKKKVDRGWLIIKPINDEIIDINLWADGRSITGDSYLADNLGNLIVDNNGNYIIVSEEQNWQVQATSNTDLINLSYRLGFFARRVQVEISNEELNKGMAISQIMYDYENTKTLK